jgi:hypothetical protein
VGAETDKNILSMLAEGKKMRDSAVEQEKEILFLIGL